MRQNSKAKTSKRRDTRLRFEQWVKNPGCEANVVSAVAGISMDKVARAEGFEPTMGQSPFAIARGTTFERTLLADDAKRLREALIKEGVLPKGSTGFLDLRLRMNSGPIATLDEAVEKTTELLQLAAAAPPKQRPTLPTIVTGAALKVPGQPVMLPEGVVCLDVLTLHDEGNDLHSCSAWAKSRPTPTGPDIRTRESWQPRVPRAVCISMPWHWSPTNSV